MARTFGDFLYDYPFDEFDLLFNNTCFVELMVLLNSNGQGGLTNGLVLEYGYGHAATRRRPKRTVNGDLSFIMSIPIPCGAPAADRGDPG